jgi:hypothetical protein
MIGGDRGFINPQFVRYDDSRANCVFLGYYGDLKPALNLTSTWTDFMRKWCGCTSTARTPSISSRGIGCSTASIIWVRSHTSTTVRDFVSPG